MGSPTTAINRFDLSMSYGEFSLLNNQMGFIGYKVLPPVFVAQDHAQFRRVNLESVLTSVEDTARAPKSTYNRDFYTWTTDTYTTQEHGVEEVVDDAEIEMYGDILRAEQLSSARAANRVIQAYESAVAAAVFNTGTWTGSSLTTAISTPWTTAASADPIADIDAAREKVESGCGMAPNTLILTDYALRKMKRTDRIEELLKYSGIDDPKMITLPALAELLELEQIIVAKRGTKNTADRGQTASLSRFWGNDKAMLCHMSMNPDPPLEDPEPTIGRTIQFSKQAPMPGEESNVPALVMEEYREESRRGGVIRARTNYGIKILHPEAGHLLTSVTA